MHETSRLLDDLLLEVESSAEDALFGLTTVH
jgi:hypothetical protein